MPLKNLRSISFTNGLEDKVSDVVMVYRESNIWIHDYMSTLFTKVDVETSKNTLWSRCVFMEEPLDSSKTVNLPAEHVCFGGYTGYWQLYFIYKGEHYKLYKNNCKMALSPEYDQQELKIELLSLRNMKAKFQISTRQKEFKIIKGICVVNRLNVSISNGMNKDIDFINLELTAVSSSETITLPHSSRFVFDKDRIKSRETSSRDMLIYDCIGFKHYFKLNFAVEGVYYEVLDGNKVNDFGIPIILGEEKYNDFLQIIFLSTNFLKRWKILVVNKNVGFMNSINPLKSNSQFEIMPFLAVMTERFDDRNERIYMIYQIQRNKFEQEIYVLINALRRLCWSDMKGTDEANITEVNGPMLFGPCMYPKLAFDEELLNNKNIRIQSSLKTEWTLLKNAVRRIDKVKIAWEQFIISLRNLLPLLGFLNLTRDELHQITNDLVTIESMNVIDVLCKMLIPSGLDEFGLTFHICESDSSKEISIDPKKLSFAIEEEVELWTQGIVSNYGKDPKFLNETHALKSEIDKKNFSRITELFVLLRKELIEKLRIEAEAMHFHSRNVNISLVTSSALGFVRTGCSVAMLALAAPTAGVSLVLTSTIMAVRLTSSTLEIGAKTIGNILIKKGIDSLVSLATKDQHVYRLLASLKQNMKPNSIFHRPNLSGGSEEIAREVKKTLAVKTLKTVYSSFEDFKDCVRTQICNSSRVNSGTRNFFGIGPVAASFLIDLNVLAFRSFKLSKGGYSKYGNKLEAEALSLEKELEELCSDE